MEFLNSKKGTYVGIFILGLLVVGGFFYTWQSRQNALEEQSVVLGSSTEVVDENYTLYTNVEYAYSFEFPTIWEIDDSNRKSVMVSDSGLGSKNIVIDIPYADDILGDSTFLDWASEQEWPYSPATPSEYFEEIKTPSGMLTYKRASTTAITTVIIPTGGNILYISREDGTGEGTLGEEDIYFHLLNSFREI